MIAWPPPAEETQLAKPSHELEAFLKTAPRFQPAEVQHYTARDGVERPYRQYDGAGKDALIFLHGSTGDSRYLALLSRRIAARTGLTVVTPDMRGHGFAPQRRGDDDYVGQQEHDIADLITALRARNFRRIFIGGHSLGGGAMIRYAAGSETPRADGLILLAPIYQPGLARRVSVGWRLGDAVRAAPHRHRHPAALQDQRVRQPAGPALPHAAGQPRRRGDEPL
jgi:pimeloyl-ACP methyl ester carboxylesterase